MEIQECPRLSNMLSSDVKVDLQGEDKSNPLTHFSPTNDLDELNKNNQEKIENDLLSREFSSRESAYKFYVQYGGERVGGGDEDGVGGCGGGDGSCGGGGGGGSGSMVVVVDVEVLEEVVVVVAVVNEEEVMLEVAVGEDEEEEDVVVVVVVAAVVVEIVNVVVQVVELDVEVRWCHFLK
ncbi:unnamed protein product [Prunus armeniaca]